MKRILVTFAGGQLGRGITQALRADGPVHIIAADADGYALFQSDGDERYIIPMADDPDYMNVLRDLVKKTQPDLVWPMHDKEIGRVVADTEPLGARTFLPPRRTVEICHDKFESFKAFKAAGVPVPDTIMVNSEGDLKEAFRRFDGHIWLRPVSGAGGRGALGTDNPELALIWMKSFDGWGHYSAAERLAARGHTFESVWRDGELIAAQANSRKVGMERPVGTLVQGPPPGLGLRRRYGAEPVVSEVAIAAIHAVTEGKPHGIYSVDMNSDRNGHPCVTEINIGRFGMSGAIVYYNHGANFPAIAMKTAFGEDLGFDPPLLQPLRTDVAVVLSIGHQPVEVLDTEYEALQAEYRDRMGKLR